MLDTILFFVPEPWRERVAAVFLVGFFLALVGRKIGAAVIARARAAGKPEPAWARWLVEIGPGLRAVGDAVAPHLPPPARAVLDSLTESDPPPGGAR